MNCVIVFHKLFHFKKPPSVLAHRTVRPKPPKDWSALTLGEMFVFSPSLADWQQLFYSFLFFRLGLSREKDGAKASVQHCGHQIHLLAVQ